MAWPEWIGLLGTVFVAVAGGSWIGDLLSARTRRTLDVHTAHVDDVGHAADALVEFASLVSRRNASGDETLDHALRRAGNALEAAVAMVRGDDLGPPVREYVTVGEAFAGGDPDMPEGRERENFRFVLNTLRQARLSPPKDR